MRVLLDECVPKRLRTEFAGHDVLTVGDAGWSGLTNGELLARAATNFDCFFTVDRNLQFQQNPSSLPLAVVILVAPNNRIETLRRGMAGVLASLSTIKRGELVTVQV